MTAEEVAISIAEELRSICKQDRIPLNMLRERGLFDLGVESHHLGYLLEAINNRFGVELVITDFFDYSNVNKLAMYISDRAG
jgi:acyl carrier protein